jgi:hypothetical protein
MSKKDDALIFVCDEAACHEDPMFYEIFPMDERWSIIRAIIKAAKAHEAAQFTQKSAQGTP